MPRPPRFTIRAASALTGINQNTLRAWERRHALVRPERTPKGYRLYSEADIRRLRVIQRALAEGVAIGRMRAYLETAGTVERLQRGDHDTLAPAGPRETRLVEVSLSGAGLAGSTTIRIPAESQASVDGPVLASFAQQIEEAALGFDRAALDRVFSRVVGLYSLRQAFHCALAPALTRIGQRHLDDQTDAAAERFLTAFARQRLQVALAGLRPLHQQPRALFACLPGEQQETLLLLLSLEVGLEGVSALYLGADTSMTAVEQAARSAGSRAVALTATLALPLETVLDVRDRLAALPKRPHVLVGGPAAWRHVEWLEANGVGLLSLEPEEAAAQVLQAIGQD